LQYRRLPGGRHSGADRFDLFQLLDDGIHIRVLYQHQSIAIPAITCLPQVTEANTPQPQDVAGEYSLYHEYMTRVYIADAKSEERTALRVLLLDLKMEIVGEAADWVTTLTQAPVSRTDMLLIDWDLLPNSPTAALEEIRRACPAALVIVLISHLDARQQAALSAGADAFISKGETPERVAERLRAVARGVRI
jgi:CheY-like chemotaxis protein